MHPPSPAVEPQSSRPLTWHRWRDRRPITNGSIYKRQSDGRWVGSISLGTGKRKYVYGRTRADVAAKLTDALKARKDGLPSLGERQTVRDFLLEWLEAKRSSLRLRTWLRYEQFIRLHIVPGIGRIRLAKLSPQHLDSLYADRLRSGLSPASIRQLHAIVRSALSQADKWGLVQRNVARVVNPPRVIRKEIVTLSVDESRHLLHEAQGDRLEALYVLALASGMRQGELLALHWRDVDLDKAAIKVTATLQRTPEGFRFEEPKTATSRRQVELTRAAVDSLRRHRARQMEEHLRQGLSWSESALVFSNGGKPIDNAALLRRSFYPLLERADLPRIRFHDLRHTSATLLLSEGVHPKIVSEMLGHSNIAITLDLYSHVTPTMQRQAVAALDALLG